MIYLPRTEALETGAFEAEIGSGLFQNYYSISAKDKYELQMIDRGI